METTVAKPSLLSNILLRLLSFAVLACLSRFAYIITVRGKSCDSGDFCIFSSVPDSVQYPIAMPEIPVPAISTAADDDNDDGSNRLRGYYSSVFQDLMAVGYLSIDSKALCIETLTGQDVVALRDIGVADSIGISNRHSPPLVLRGDAYRQPFRDGTFDFEFAGIASLDRSPKPVDFALEVSRTLKSGGFFVLHTAAKDMYSINSLLELFTCCRLINSRDIHGVHYSTPSIREIVLKKENQHNIHDERRQSFHVNSSNNCSIPGYKLELIQKAEPMIREEPLKPWITLKRNIKNIRYLPSMADISFKQRYLYIDVGARNYGSSIGNWFKKHYPKQNKTFEVYAIEADKAFHAEYKLKNSLTLLPYAAWVRNETLFFEINRVPSKKNNEKNRGMGRIQSVLSSSYFLGDVDKIQGFDFADWLKNVASERDFVVVKMDVEGTEFELIPKLVETGAICLIDEMLLECHYNRWQRCCPGERTSKFRKTYDQCLELFTSLRESGVLVHQWW